jgi:hypothetical protein
MNREIPMKQFLAEEAIRLNLNPVTIWYRLRDGKYPNHTVRRVNKRVAFVTPIQQSANQRSNE